uniref:Uncharacterized protein n=1 Tax=Clostridium argentinense TaxID=29341 RepID=A0A7I6ND31_9CLOT|nr:hypothetical protein [Clostridium argentinense]
MTHVKKLNLYYIKKFGEKFYNINIKLKREGIINVKDQKDLEQRRGKSNVSKGLFNTTKS